MAELKMTDWEARELEGIAAQKKAVDILMNSLATLAAPIAQREHEWWMKVKERLGLDFIHDVWIAHVDTREIRRK